MGYQKSAVLPASAAGIMGSKIIREDSSSFPLFFLNSSFITSSFQLY